MEIIIVIIEILSTYQKKNCCRPVQISEVRNEMPEVST
jgi:hypothetical protein